MPQVRDCARFELVPTSIRARAVANWDEREVWTDCQQCHQIMWVVLSKGRSGTVISW